MRATSHTRRGSSGAKGASSAKHNDRQFDTSKARHIDPERTSGNRYWHCYLDEPGGRSMTFEAAEKRYYKETFSAFLDDRNERQRAARHYDRVMSMDDYRRAEATGPEDYIFQLGDKNNHVDAYEQWEMAGLLRDWIETQYPLVHVLDMALHVDEEGGPHVHFRWVWTADDGKGNVCVGQNKALYQMGVQPPDAGGQFGRHNNAKQTFSANLRNHVIEMCRERGYEIDDKPKERSQVGLSLVEYQARQEEAKAAAAVDRAQEAQKAVDYLEADNSALETKNAELRASLDATSKELSDKDAALAGKDDSIAAKQAALDQMDKDIADRKAKAEPLEALSEIRATKTITGKIVMPQEDYAKIGSLVATAIDDREALKTTRKDLQAANARIKTIEADLRTAEAAQMSADKKIDGLERTIEGYKGDVASYGEYLRRFGLTSHHDAWQAIAPYEAAYDGYLERCKAYDALEVGSLEWAKARDPRGGSVEVGDKRYSARSLLLAYAEACEQAGITPRQDLAEPIREAQEAQERRQHRHDRGNDGPVL